MDGSSITLDDGKDAINQATRRFMAGSMYGTAGKGSKGKTNKGFVGGGKESGFVNTPINAPKKGFKGK